MTKREFLNAIANAKNLSAELIEYAAHELETMNAMNERNRAKELIADLMIATNGVTAQFLDAHGLPSIRRLLKAPARWDRIVKLAAEHGHALPAVADALARPAGPAPPSTFLIKYPS